MKKIAILTLTVAFATATTAFVMHQNGTLSIGEKAPRSGLKMKDVSGNMLALNDLKKENGLLVIFSCNNCPFVVGGPGYGEGWENRYNELNGLAARSEVGMVLVNSNEGKRSGADSFEKMVERAQEKGYKAHYVMDTNSQLANAFGARTTPHVFLFGKDMELIYAGAIDDSNEKAAGVKEHWLKNALAKVAAGTPDAIDPKSTRQKGCSIKRVKK